MSVLTQFYGGGGVGTVYTYTGSFTQSTSGQTAVTDIIHVHNLNLTDGYTVPCFVGNLSQNVAWNFSLTGGGPGAYPFGTGSQVNYSGGAVNGVTWSANQVSVKTHTASAPSSSPSYTGSLQILY